MENLMEREEEPAEDIIDASLVHNSRRIIIMNCHMFKKHCKST